MRFFRHSSFRSLRASLGALSVGAATLLLAAADASAQVVISQVYGGAGCGTAGCSTYKNDYIELFNRGAAPASVNGFSVQYAAATGTTWQVTSLPNVTIPAGGYFLVAESTGANGINVLPTADATGSIAMSATVGKIALVNVTTALSGACPVVASILDLVGYGTTANCNEGGANAPAPSTTTADVRAAGGCTDTNSNSADFAAAAPTPRNSASPTNSCSSLPNLTINDVSLNEGNAGTTSFTFTVSLSAPAGPGGVTFDIATADGTSVQPGDYTLKSLTAQTIPAGSSTYSFTVLANGDVTPETNETFLVNVTNVTGANVTDGQGQGTIVNDDAAPNLTINDVSLNEGNAGTTSFTFTVSLSAPAGAGGVTFDIATADGTASQPGDYTQKSLTAQTIPAGSSTYSFTVLANGDTASELNETFVVNVTNLTNAIGTDTQGAGTIVNDDLTFIHDVQGNGAATPIPGATVSVEGVVVADFQGSNQLSGFFLQEEDADVDADPNTSEGIFIFCSGCPTAVAEGQRVQVTGVVSEFFNLTEITASTAGSVVITNAGNNLASITPSPIDLPIAGSVDAFYEAREGMKVTFVDSLSVSEYFELPQYGQLSLYEGGRPRQFTEFNTPSVAGYNAHVAGLSRRLVILDDDNNAQNSYLATSAPPGPANGSQAAFFPRANGGFSVGTQGTDFFRGGDLVNGLTGVLHWSFAGGLSPDAWRIRPTSANPATFTVANPRPATPPSVGGAIRVVGMNLLNYFTTIDTTSSNNTGPCAPSGTLDCRGADSVAELNRQRDRASLVVCTMNADVYGFAELENTTPSATITDLVGAVNAQCGGAHPYTFVNTGGTLGTDAIRVQQIYRTGIVSPVGAPLSDLDPIHSRPPTAQTYDVVDALNPAFGQRFTVIINHLKSKGSSAGLPGDADIGDGVGASNATRTAQANRLLTWITSTVLPAAGDPDVLLLGDFNAYAKEDPITALVAGGFNDLETTFHGANAYSYLFDGQLGHLDYGFASSSLLAQVTGADAWHINADESDLLDYNDEIKDTGESNFEEKPDGSTLVPPRVVFQPGTPYRASDHDPIIVGLFPAADLAVTKSGSPGSVPAGSNLTYTITVTNNGPDVATGASMNDTLPAGTTFVSLTSPGGWSCTTPAVGAGGVVSCSNASFTVGAPVFTLVAKVGVSVPPSTTITNTATVTATTADSNGLNNSDSTTSTVICPAISLALLPNGTVGSAYPGAPSASGGVGPYSYALTSGSIPSGLTLNASDPAGFTGNLSATGTFNFQITATDTAGAGTCTGSQNYTVLVGSDIAAGDLVVREFRSRGLGGVTDEYIEISNRASGPLTIASTDGSAGFGIGAQNAGASCPGTTQILATIPNGTVIPAGGSFLAAHNAGYTLGSYGGAGAANPNATWSLDLCDGSGIGLFRSSTTASTGTRIDAVGFEGISTSPYIESPTGLPSTWGAVNVSGQYAFVRKVPYRNGGMVQDTNDNAADFYFVSPDAGIYSAVQTTLGAPGPQNLASPAVAALPTALADPMLSANVAPNRVQSGNYFYFRRALTNNTGTPITKLRFRILDLTTYQSDGYNPLAQADWRGIDTTDVVLSLTDTTTPTAKGLTLEFPSVAYSAVAKGVGINGSFTVNLGGSLANGATIYVNFGMRQVKGGPFYFVIVPEVLN